MFDEQFIVKKMLLAPLWVGVTSNRVVEVVGCYGGEIEDWRYEATL